MAAAVMNSRRQRACRGCHWLAWPCYLEPPQGKLWSQADAHWPRYARAPPLAVGELQWWPNRRPLFRPPSQAATTQHARGQADVPYPGHGWCQPQVHLILPVLHGRPHRSPRLPTPLPPSRRRRCRLLLWPRCCGLHRAKPSSSAGAQGHVGARATLGHRRR
jgi:hypothetical protein